MLVAITVSRLGPNRSRDIGDRLETHASGRLSSERFGSFVTHL